MRERSPKSRLATSLPLSVYWPAVGVSRRPRIERSVDLPQPEAARDGEMNAGEGVGFDLVGVEDLGEVLDVDEIACR